MVKLLYPDWRPVAGPVILLLLAFAARIYALDYRPLWWDEGLTLTFAYLPPAHNVTFAVATADVNPPLYRWTTGVLTYLTGVSIFTTRLTGVYSSLILVAAAYALGRRLLGRPAALYALPLLAFAPLQIYYAQEAKGYAFAGAAVLLNLIFWWALQQHWAGSVINRQEVNVKSAPANVAPSFFSLAQGNFIFLIVGYALTLLLALGANYLVIFALITQNLFIAGFIWEGRRRGMGARPLLRCAGRWAVLQLAAALPLLPFVLATFGSTTSGLNETSATEQSRSMLVYMASFLFAFVAGDQGKPALLPALPLLALAFWGGWQGRRPWSYSKLALWLWLLIPVLLGYLFQQRFPWFYPRFLLYVQPVLLLLAGAGLAALARRRQPAISLALFLLLLALHLPWLRQQYRAPYINAEDPAWPALFAAMGSYSQPGDGLVARYLWLPGYMKAYLPATTQPDWVLGHFDAATLDEEMAAILGQYGRLWQIDYHLTPFDPHNDSAQWLRGRAALAHWQQHGPGSLALYVAREQLDDTAVAVRHENRFQNGVHLRWSPVAAAKTPGAAAGLQLVWWTERPLDTHLIRFLHLLDGDGFLVAQSDSEPGGGRPFTYDWPPDTAVIDPAALLLPLDLPPGRYALRVGLYDRETLTRVPLDNGDDSLSVGHLEVR